MTAPEYHLRGWRMSKKMLIVRLQLRQRSRRTRMMKLIATEMGPRTRRVWGPWPTMPRSFWGGCAGWRQKGHESGRRASTEGRWAWTPNRS